jgi:amino acid transporter
VQTISRQLRLAALAIKTLGFAVGAGAAAFAVVSIYFELGHLAAGGTLGAGDVVVVLAMMSLAFSGTALMAQLPDSFKARFRRSPQVGRSKPVYGFGTMVAVGVGATLGSPLFILIPLNIEQYEFVSLASLALATVFSVTMAKVFADMSKESRLVGEELVGSPSFVRIVAGPRSVRYFVSRLSMWIANTALAAYTEIVFLIFDFVFMPQVLSGLGVGAQTSTIVTWSIAAAFAGWTMVNVFFERRYLRALGKVQIVLTSALVILIVAHSFALGNSGDWSFSGLFQSPGGTSWVTALVINTGYLYLLFFGFQEIQVLERDSFERSQIPIVSWIRKGYTMGRTAYFEAAMIISVLIAASINIFYGLAVYSAGRGLESLQATCSTSSCIPALFLAQNALGVGQELLIGVAFLIATVTTFVPAFLAAARHLVALGEDGYMPASVARLSWLFTVVAIVLLAIGGQNFLVEITDVMVLISLGIISLAGAGGRMGGGRSEGGRALPVVVGAACFLFGGAIYFNPGGATVVVFGTIAIIFAYLIFDIFELGALGAQAFLAVFGLASLFALGAFNYQLYAGSVVVSLTDRLGIDPDALLAWGLLVSSALLAVNVIFDMRLFRRSGAGPEAPG